ncbi:DUF6642 family protein [Candidatus Cloacimonadota bacterium]
MTKGIFCLEGLWYDDLRKRSTVKPILELLELNSNIPFLHSDCATIEEFKFYIKKWKASEYDRYPILYLAFHGTENGIQISNKIFTLDELSAELKGKCKNRVFLFAACNSMKTDKRNLKRFLRETKALAICGYRKVVPWINSTAFELLLLAAMQDNALDGRGIEAIQRRVESISKPFKELDFLMLTNKEV